MPVDVVITRTNSIVNSPRVRKIAGSLSSKYKVRVIGWNREGIQRKDDQFNTGLDLLNFKGPIGRTVLLLYLPVFWIYLFAKLVKYRPSVVHACDLDALLPSLLFKTIFRKKIVFDVCDRYAMSKISEDSRFLYSFINWLEEYLGQKVDFMINVSEKMTNTFKRKPKKLAIIMNCADPNLERMIKTRSEIRSANGDKDNLILVYTGNIIRKRGLEQISTVLKNVENVTLIIAGKVIDPGLLNELTNQTCIRYRGQLPLPEALSLEAAADVIVILYDKDIPNNRYATPNKFFEAMMFGIPVITNVLDEIVRDTNCGLLVEYKDVEQITKGIIALRDDPNLRKELGLNGRIAFERQYNWSSMEKILFNLYQELLVT